MIAFRLPALAAFWFLILGGPASGRGNERAEDGSLGALLEAPCERWSDVPGLQERILELGPRVLPELFQLWSTGGGETRLDRMREIAVMGALERFPRPALVSHLDRISRADGNTAERAGALRLLNRIATPGDLQLCLRLAAQGEDVDRALLGPVEECLSLLVDRHSSVAADLGDSLPWIPQGLRVSAVKTIAALADHAALDVLSDCVGKVPRIDALLLLELVQLLRSGVTPGDHHLETFRGWLDLQDPAAVKLAVLLLARVHDVHAVPELIELLETEEHGERAHQTLRSITSLNLPPAAQPWLSWYALEEEWLVGDGAEQLRGLAAEDPRTVAAALRGLAGHPLFADEIAVQVTPVLSRSESRIVALACGVLGELRARRAIPALVDCLEHAEPQVRNAAGAALQRITGLKLPAEAEPWRGAFDPPLETSWSR